MKHIHTFNDFNSINESNKSDPYMGFGKDDYEALVSTGKKALKGKTPEKTMNSLLAKFPKLGDAEGSDLLNASYIINSPVRNSFTAFDLMSYLKKQYS